MNSFWELEQSAPSHVMIDGVGITKGSRVRLHPKPGGDIMDIALAGRTATVESIAQDFEDQIFIAVTVDDDPGKDLGDARQPGHRFFFSVEEIAPIDSDDGVEF